VNGCVTVGFWVLQCSLWLRRDLRCYLNHGMVILPHPTPRASDRTTTRWGTWGRLTRAMTSARGREKLFRNPRGPSPDRPRQTGMSTQARPQVGASTISALQWSARTVHGSSRAPCRLDCQQGLRGLSNDRRQLLVVLGLMSNAMSRSCEGGAPSSSWYAEQLDDLADHDGGVESASSRSS